jgi:CelD/BcsL family acetyltransferase involved in cellulose biosynthesis
MVSKIDDVLVQTVSWREWDQHSSIWELLSQKSRPCSMFLKSIWVKTWLEVFGPLLNPNILIFRAAGQPVGICVLSLVKRKRFKLEFTEVHLNCSGELGYDTIYIEYNHLIRDPVFSKQVVDSFFDYLNLRRSTWDILNLRGLVDEELKQKAHKEFLILNETKVLGVYAKLDPKNNSSKVVLDNYSSNTRQQIRRSTRYYEQHYGACRLVVASSREQRQIALDAFKKLHLGRWAIDGSGGAMSALNNETFHRAIVQLDKLETGLELVQVYAGEQLLGVLYNVVVDNEVQFYQSGFEFDESSNDAKPGLVSHALAMQHYRDLGFEVYDFMAGDLRYKRSLGKFFREFVWVEFHQSNSLRLFAVKKLRSIKRRFSSFAKTAQT